MSFEEIRVRPVVRHVVTRFTQDGRSASSEAIGEFANENYAEEVAEALRAKSEPKRFVLIEESPIANWPLVLYAYSREEAQARCLEMLQKYEIGMRIFERPVDDRSWAIPAAPTDVAPERSVAPMKSLEEYEDDRKARIQRYFDDVTESMKAASRPASEQQH